MKTEERNERESVGYIIEDGLLKYKTALKTFLQLNMEELYGGGKDYPKTTEENEEAITEIWDKAVESCIEIVKTI